MYDGFLCRQKNQKLLTETLKTYFSNNVGYIPVVTETILQANP